MNRIKNLHFKPLFGIPSKHLQTFLPLFYDNGVSPPSKSWRVDLEDGDFLSCEVSTPLEPSGKTVVLVHGLGGSHESGYMIRLSRQLFERGDKVVRINLRSCGSGEGLSKLPYHGGLSHDVLKVLQALKREHQSIVLIGFSLGGNIVLKLAGELGTKAAEFVKKVIAVCPPLDLADTVRLIERRRYHVYHSYYLKKICKQAKRWLTSDVHTLSEFDEVVTAKFWGYQGADEYYRSSSSFQFLPMVRSPCHLLFAEDDPFIRLDRLQGLSLSDQVHIWTTTYGGHMGFIGKTEKKGNFFWMDQLLLKWINEDG